jgi:hypothetical protein
MRIEGRAVLSCAVLMILMVRSAAKLRVSNHEARMILLAGLILSRRAFQALLRTRVRLSPSVRAQP